jgi:hypothetical protein
VFAFAPAAMLATPPHCVALTDKDPEYPDSDTLNDCMDPEPVEVNVSDAGAATGAGTVTI